MAALDWKLTNGRRVPTCMSIHYRAMFHLDKAKGLLASNESDHLRYAALELRYCIELLFYSLVPHYKDELPDDVVAGNVWRPADIIDMIADIDPDVSQDREIRMGEQPGPGLPPTRMFVLGRQSGLSKDLIRKVYHKLGFYLHARTDQKPHDPSHLRKRLEKLLPYLERYRSDTLRGGGIAEKAYFKCVVCGRPVVHRVERAKLQPLIKCPNKNCGAIHEYIETGNPKESLHKVLQHNLKCVTCGADNWLDVHRLEEGANVGAIVNCHACPTRYRLQRYVQFQRLDENDTQQAVPPNSR